MILSSILSFLWLSSLYSCIYISVYLCDVSPVMGLRMVNQLALIDHCLVWECWTILASVDHGCVIFECIVFSLLIFCWEFLHLCFSEISYNFLCVVFIWFWYQSDVGFMKLLSIPYFSVFLKSLIRIDIKSSLNVRIYMWSLWSCAFVLGEVFMFPFHCLSSWFSSGRL